MVGIDLTIKGNSASKNRMVTEQTLDREGFFIPDPPQRIPLNRNRGKSAIGIGRREISQKPLGQTKRIEQRPKSSKYPSSIQNRYEDSDDEIIMNENDKDEEELEDFKNSGNAQKMSVNLRWVYQGDAPKWKPRSSQVPERRSSARTDKNSLKQQINVCEVIAKMKSRDSDCEPSSKGSAAPPSSPKSTTNVNAIIGKRFVQERPQSAPQSKFNQTPSYMAYAKSRPKSGIANPTRKTNAFLQPDTSNTDGLYEDISTHSSSLPGERELPRDIIEIPFVSEITQDMFTTDEPDEESVAVVDSNPAIHHQPAPPRPSPETSPMPTRATYGRVASLTGSRAQSRAPPPPRAAAPRHRAVPPPDLYKSVYLKDYREHSSAHYRETGSARLGRPKSETAQIRYCPDTYRFQEARYTPTEPRSKHKEWDRDQPRAPVGNTRVVSTRRPSQFLYPGVS